MLDKPALTDTLLGDRYRTQRELGRGGMARVYAVRDERTGQQLALKQLLVTSDQGSKARVMFEREYHTLAQLTHPHIVRVFDYGLFGDDPYYTMELLEGADARDASRTRALDVPQLCLLMRDCASALALIHSRRMVHRDVSTRNLWCTPEARGKLIDFGALVAMGPQSRVAGTPPFVPPEALSGQPLDARSDLYALGAVSYYLLTQRNAYPARALGDLWEYWRRIPRSPHALRPELPEALSDLVMALLSLDPRGRPGAASEVYERLSAIAELPAEDGPRLGQSFLSSPSLVGRSDAIVTIEHRLQRCVQGRGSHVSVLGRSGLGRSRLLANGVLQAKLMGAVAVSVGATAVASARLSVGRAIVEQLALAMPMLPASASELGPLLGHLSMSLHEAFGKPPLIELSAAEYSGKLSAAIVSLVKTATCKQPVVLVVDDVHRADVESLGVLGRIALLASEQKLLLLTSCDQGALRGAPPALEQLVRARFGIELQPISAEQTHELLESLFGTVPGLDAAAQWIREVSGGSPQGCMEYAQYLVDQGVARFERGHWQLPLQLHEQGLPKTLGTIIDIRIAELSADAKALAVGLAIARDESRSAWQPELHIHLEHYAELLDRADPARASAALNELLQTGIVQQRDAYYVLSQRAMVDALVRSADEQLQRQTHARLANIFSKPGYLSSWFAIRHMQRAGEHRRARNAIVEYASSPRIDFSAMRVSVQSQCAKTAVEHWQTEGGTPKEGLVLRRLLLTTATVYDWSLARFGEAQLAQLRHDSGLSHWDQIEGTSNALERLGECLKRAQQVYDQTPEAARGVPPLQALIDFAGSSILLGKAYGYSFDVAHMRELLPLLDALRPVNARIVIVSDQIHVGLDRASGREFGDALLDTARRLLSDAQVDHLRIAGAILHLHEQVLEHARLGRGDAMNAFRDLEPHLPWTNDHFFALHSGWLMHSFCGNAAAAKPYYKKLGLITEDDVWRRKAYLFYEVELYALAGDLKGLQRCSEAMAELADTFPGWQPWSSFARAATHQLLGNFAAAKAELEYALASARPGEHRAWVLAAPMYIETLLMLGDVAGASQQAELALAAIETKSLFRSAMVAAQRALALVRMRQSRYDDAREAMSRAMALARELSYGGLPLAILYETHVRVLIASGATDLAAQELKQVWQLIEHSEAPSIIHAYSNLREQCTAGLAQHELPAPTQRSLHPGSFDPSSIYTEVHKSLNSASTLHDRAVQSLTLLLEDAGASAGHLLLFNAHGLFAAAAVNDQNASDEMLHRAQQYLEANAGEAKTVTQTASDEPLQVLVSHGDLEFAPVVLANRTTHPPVVVGLALLMAHDGELRPPQRELVHAISQCLLATGDSVSVVLDV